MVILLKPCMVRIEIHNLYVRVSAVPIYVGTSFVAENSCVPGFAL